MKKSICILAAIMLFLNSAPAQSEQSIVAKNNSAQLQTYSKSIDKFVGHFDNKIKIVFSDIDGTLLPTGKNAIKGEVPQSAKNAAQKLRTAQIPLILATGRSYWEAKQIAIKMGNENCYIIAQQGAEIMNPSGKIIYQDSINSKIFKMMLRDIDTFKKKSNLDSKVFFVADSKPYATQDFDLPYIWEPRTVIKSYDELGANLAYTKISICEKNPEKLKLIQAHLKKKFPNYHIDIAADCYCDITSATATKGNAIKNLANILGANLSNAAVIGDAENDISMLKLIKENGGLAIAVDNAMDSVKNNASFVTLSVFDGGFAKAVDEIIKNNALLKNNID